MEKQFKIYIAGHLGMVGSAIKRSLESKGYSNFIDKSIDELDLTRQALVEDFFNKERPDVVIDAAAKVGGIQANNIYRAQFLYENLAIQNNIIHSSYLYGVKKLLFLGSSCIYPKLAPQPLKEEYLLSGELEPTNEPYAIAKITGIKMCESYFRQYGCNFVSVMPTNLYGPKDNYNLETSHVLPALIRKLHLGKCMEQNNWQHIREDLNKRPIEGIDGNAEEDIILALLKKYGIEKSVKEGKNNVAVRLWGTGKIFREFMHVNDMAAACTFILEHIDMKDIFSETDKNKGCGFINIGTGEDVTIFEVAQLISKITGFSGEIEWDGSKPDGTPKKLMDISRLKSLGFKHKFSLKEGIENVYHLLYS